MKTAEYLSKTYGMQESTTCGIYLRKDCPLYGASPDGIRGDFIIEIKCPYKRRTVSTYVKDGCILKKILFQMQLEMHCAENQEEFWPLLISSSKIISKLLFLLFNIMNS